LSTETTRTVIILSGTVHEAVEDKISAKDYVYKRRSLNSSVENWAKIVTLIQNLRNSKILIAILAYFTEETLFYTSDKYFDEHWPYILDEITKGPSLIFIYEDNLSGTFSRITEKENQIQDLESKNALQSSLFRTPQAEEEYYRRKIEEERESLAQLKVAATRIHSLYKAIYDRNIEVVPYRKRAEINIRAQDFIDEVEGGVFLRLYIPNGKYQAEQFASILRLFENYLQTVEGRPILIETRKTQNGVVYIFRDKDQIINAEEFQHTYNRFEGFMELTQRNSKEAEVILQRLGMKPINAFSLVSKYAKECTRLKLDAKYEEERKLLEIKYRFQNELLEITDGDATRITQAIQLPSVFSLSNNTGPITITLSNLSASDSAVIESIVQQEVNGGVIYTSEDNQLIGLFNKYADTLAAVALKSELDQLKDTSLPTDERKTAKQRITGFLYKVGQVASDVGVNVLTTYLEKLLTGQTTP